MGGLKRSLDLRVTAAMLVDADDTGTVPAGIAAPIVTTPPTSVECANLRCTY